ncbi:hypothetical protein [Glutamicibacter sp. TV12E]|uniref:hypothetical protein n=1 Tax=Glutamicibacter sp. TV12E TaxID=3446362 RepID=UPI00403475D1
MFIKIGSIEAGGNTNPILIENLSAPSTELRTEYVDAPNRDGQLVGRDFLGSSTWGFDFVSNKSNLQESFSEIGKLEHVWKDSKNRLSSNVAFPLRYSLDGTNWYRVYGRCGKFTGSTPDVLATLGVARATADFVQTRVEHFSDIENLNTITYIPPVQGGLKAPLVSPLTTTGRGVERGGFVDNEGNVATPLSIRFVGPISNPVLRSETGWEVSYRGSIAAGDYVDINPLMGTVKRKNGSSVAGNLGTKVRLSKVNLPVGRSNLYLSGNDSTGLSKVELRWRNAWTSAQY